MRLLNMGLVAAGLCTALSMTAFPAQADQIDFSTWYLKAEGGWSFGAETEVESPDTSFDLDDDVVFGGGIGYRFADNWRAELDVAYQSHDTDADGNAFIVGGDVSAITAMPVVYYDFNFGSPLKPFIGAGIGAARIDADYGVLNPPFENRSDDAQWALAWQGTAGVSYQATRNIALTARYRYLDAGNYDVGRAEADYRSHAVLAGLTFTFGAPAPAPKSYDPEPAPAAPAPAPVAELPKEEQIIIYFRFDDAGITPQAAAKLDDAAEAIRDRGVESVKVVGYTDTTGPASYNQWLSQARALAVRAGLIERGVAASFIEVDARGETGLRVPTADGVKEQENRRSEVSIFYID